jgi:transketolase
VNEYRNLNIYSRYLANSGPTTKNRISMTLSTPCLSPSELALKSAEYRRTLLTMIKHANSGHTGGSLSCVDILNVLYNAVLRVDPADPANPRRDRYIHSKGHSVEALYTVLCDRGFFPASELETFERFGSHFIGHPTRKLPGIEQNTGSLGHGLPLAVGAALAAKKDDDAFRVFTLLGDGELSEGSIWEASLSAAHYHLDNLTVIIDRNGLQITGPTEQVMGVEPLEDKLRAFGYAVRSVAGNDVAALCAAFDGLPFEPGKPNLLLARTTKGKGVSYMENNHAWHHRVPTDEEFAQAMEELVAVSD